MDSTEVIKAVRDGALPLSRLVEENYTTLCNSIGNAQVVMIGEATHGTSDFYKIRAEITKVLVQNHGFNFVCCEADFVDMYRVNRFVQSLKSLADEKAKDAFGSFQRYPRWMWRNEETVEFVEWLKKFNMKRNGAEKVGIYGVDIYSLWETADAIVRLLQTVDKQQAQFFSRKVQVFEQFKDDMHRYADAVRSGQMESQEVEMAMAAIEIMESASSLLSNSALDEEEVFFLAQSVQVVKNSEEYYRSTHMGSEVTWNLRDNHMTDTVSDIIRFYQKQRPDIDLVKCVVWAHNSHIGDAGATLAGCERHELNLGQLLRQRYEIENTFNIGFTTFEGTVAASNHWGGARQTFVVNRGFPDSYEDIFHRVSSEDSSCESNFVVFLRSNGSVLPNKNTVKMLMRARMQRMIGVQYKKETEVESHYFECCLPYQFDCLIHIDKSSAVHALDSC